MPFTDDMIGIHDVSVNGASPVPRRSVLNFVGTGVGVADDPVNGCTNVTLPSATGGATITASVLGGDVNDYSPTGHATASVERWSSGATPRTVTGLSSTGQARPMVINYGQSAITLSHESASSLAANRFRCPGQADYVLEAQSAVELIRDSVDGRWRVVS